MIQHFPTVATGAPVETPFKLEMHICDQRRSYLATFYRECDAVAFIRRHQAANEALADAGTFSGGYAWFPLEDSPVPDQWDALFHMLFPTCEHGLSADLCMGPGHYPSREWEMERYGY